MQTELTDLGWANDWTSTPEVVTKCREEKHAEKGLTDSHSNYERCISTYSCPICGYVYKVDSSD